MTVDLTLGAPMSIDESSAARFTAADGRFAMLIISGGFVTGSVAMINSAFEHRDLDIGTLLFSICMMIVSMVVFLSTLRGYAVSVTESSVKLHRLWTREIPFDRIASVDVTGRIMRTVQQRVCLRFTYHDGSTYLFKDFSGSTSQSSESSKCVYGAMLLIRQRLEKGRVGFPVEDSEIGREGVAKNEWVQFPPPPPSYPGPGGPHDCDNPGEPRA